jgi:general secretion pathway protein K
MRSTIPSSFRALRTESGIALFLVLWVLTLLSVIVGEFCYAMRTEVNVTRNFREQTQAYYIALAGINKAISELVRNDRIPQKLETPESEAGEQEEKEARWRINTDIEVPFGPGKFEVTIGNESGKININRAGESLLKMMLNPFELEDKEKDVIVDSIMDWRDKDNLHRLNGAEDDYYKSLKKPYECKDGDFDSIEELLMVRGVTSEIFYGGLKDVVTIFEPPEQRIRFKVGYKVISADLNKVNINAAPRKVLLALPLMTEDLVQGIMDYRKTSDFRTLNDLGSVVGTEVHAAMLPYVSLEISPYYTVISVGRLNGTRIGQGLETLVKIDKLLKKGYQVIEWRDSFEFQGLKSAIPEN